jgi:ribonuclease HI
MVLNASRPDLHSTATQRTGLFTAAYRAARRAEPLTMSHNLKRVEPSDIANAPIHDILRQCNIFHWDLMIVGDGSGSQCDNACGWSSVLIDRATGNRRLFGGHANAGSINFAESMPFIQALTWYDHFYGQHLNKSKAGLCDVHIITDSQTVANMGNQAVTAKRVSRSMTYLTSFISAFMKFKYGFTWHWMPRNEYTLTELVDRLSKQHRITAQTGRDITVPKS